MRQSVILVCGLPGSGKTTFCENQRQMAEYTGVSVAHINADKVRDAHCDWRFCDEGRIDQAIRMRKIVEEIAGRRLTPDIIYVDMVCPTPELRRIIGAPTIYFMDTIKEGRYADTNALFIPPTAEEVRHPTKFIRISEWDTEYGGDDGGVS